MSDTSACLPATFCTSSSWLSGPASERSTSHSASSRAMTDDGSLRVTSTGGLVSVRLAVTTVVALHRRLDDAVAVALGEDEETVTEVVHGCTVHQCIVCQCTLHRRGAAHVA